MWQINSEANFQNSQQYLSNVSAQLSTKNAQIQKWYKSFYIESVEKCFLHSIKILMTDQMTKTSNGTQNPSLRAMDSAISQLDISTYQH